MPVNGNILSFFKPIQQAPKASPGHSKQTPSPLRSSPPKSSPLKSSLHVIPSNATTSSLAMERKSSSSLSSPPTSSALTTDYNAKSTTFAPTTASPKASPQAKDLPSLEVKDSDEEDSNADSDSSLEDLLLPSWNRGGPSRITAPKPSMPSTPTASRLKNVTDLGSSPLSLLPKRRFDLDSLVSHNENDDATEASSKRMKAMLAKPEEDEAGSSPREEDSVPKFAHDDLLDSVVAEKEDGGKKKVLNALKRAEAAAVEDVRWYFFEPEVESVERRKFPTASIPDCIRNDFQDPQMRHSTFISGFAESIVSTGNQALPDEIILWIWDEICVEGSDCLRYAYYNVLSASSNQIRRLITPALIKNMFKKLGASPLATDISQKIKPMPHRSGLRAQNGRANTQTVIRLLGRTAEHMEEKARMFTISLLFRMSLDRILVENIDLLYIYQDTLKSLFTSIPNVEWEESCQTITTQLFTTLEPPTLRHQLVTYIPSTTPRIHTLRLHLARSFFFSSPAHSLNSRPPLSAYTHHLNTSPSFALTPSTNYYDLSSQISLLDIAVDDGLSPSLNLSDPEQEEIFHEDIQELAQAIMNINIVSGGTQYLSRIEAREVLEVVSHRIGGTLRRRPKEKVSLFEGVKVKGEKKEKFKGEMVGIMSFLGKGKEKGKSKEEEAVG